MNVDLYTIKSELKSVDLNEKIAIVIDVLRASTTICTAISNGCKSVIPVAEVDEAITLAAEFGRSFVILGGERGGKIISGFDLSNSPLEYKTETVKEKRIIFTSTNGSQLFREATKAKHTIVASFLNIKKICEFIIETNMDISILCAGGEGKFSLEDTVCGGMIINKLLNDYKQPLNLNDGAKMAEILYQHYSQNLLGMLYQASHGKRLISIGQESDLTFCIAVNSVTCIPVLSGNELIAFE